MKLFDDATAAHLDAWLNREFPHAEGREKALNNILLFCHEHPDLIEKGYGWRQILELSYREL